MRASAKGRRGEPRGERGEKRRVKMRTRKSSYIGVRTATLLRRIVGVYNENETPRLVCVCVYVRITHTYTIRTRAFLCPPSRVRCVSCPFGIVFVSPSLSYLCA